MNRLLLRAALNLVTISLLLACSSTLPIAKRLDLTHQLAHSAGFEKTVISTTEFDLVSYQRVSKKVNATVVIYIEGDGFAWKNGTVPSENPTPNNPLALSLAIQDPRLAVVYLARPCQFVSLPSKGCSQSIWTNARFSQGVIDSTNLAIESFKKQYLNM
jgi:hypothetical protein